MPFYATIICFNLLFHRLSCCPTTDNSGSHSEQQIRLGLTMLDPLVHQLFDQGLSPATKAVYQSGWRQYQHFCRQFNIIPLPLTEHSKTAFAAYLSESDSAGTIRSYLCVIRFYQIQAGLPAPNILSSSKLSYVSKGIQRKSSGHIRPQHL